MDDVAIKVDRVSKTFKLPHEKAGSVKNVLVNFARRKKGYEIQQVLKDVSFEIKKGEFFGIVGRNGSGKSTLLKMLAGIYTPTEGHIQVNGKLTPFIELGVGFNPELTGRENVFLNGALLGFNRAEMEAMYNDIVAFAELEKFMDQKLKNYSSGMQVRLAFSIAIRAQTDILLLDEVLAVGDEAFQRKCYAYFEELKRNNKTVILVTHDMSAVERFCDGAMLIEGGRVIESGNPKIVAHSYSRLFAPAQEIKSTAESSRKRWGTKELEIVNIKVPTIKVGAEVINVDVSLQCNHPVKNKAKLAYTVKSKDSRSLFGSGIELPASLIPGEVQTYRLTFNNILSKGNYFLDLSVRVSDKDTYSDFWIDAIGFSVEKKESNALSIVVDSKLEQVS